MKQIFRFFSVLMMLIVSTMVSAQSTIKVMPCTNGMVTVDMNSASWGDIVTITVTPSEGYYFRKENLEVVKTFDLNVVHTRVDIPTANILTVYNDDPQDLSTARNYTFDVYGDGYEYQISAIFTACTSITDDMVTLSATDFTYNNSDQKPTVSVNGLTEGTDYTVAFVETSWINADTYSVNVSGISMYKGTVTKKYTIAPKTVNSPTITLSKTSFVSDGTAKEPTVTVKDGGTIIPASEYTVSYSNNTKAGTAKVTISDNAGGNYIVSGSTTFEITEKDDSSTDDSSTDDSSTDDPSSDDPSSDDPSSDDPSTDDQAQETHNEEIVDYGKSVNVGDNTFYELTEKVQEAIKVKIDAIVGFTADASNRVEVTEDGRLEFSKGEDIMLALLDLKVKDIVKFVFTGRLFGDSSKLRKRNASTRGTRAAGDMELFSEVEYEVIEAGDQTVTIKLTEAEATVETISVTKPEETVTITVNKSGKNTYTTSEALDFSEVDGLKAYVATGYEVSGTIWLTRIKQVPAGTPILIKGTPEKSYEVPVMDKCVAHFENMFQGSAVEDMSIDVTSADGKWNNYYMASGSFKKVTGPRTIGKGKCYLQLPASFKAAKAGADQTVKIADSGKSSYAPPVDIDLTNVEGLKAYAATGYDAANRTIWLTRIFKIQAGEGVLLKGEKGKTYTLPSADVQAYYGNMFVGNIGDKITIGETSDDGEWTNFYLASGQFKKVSGSREIGTNKSYLQLPTSMLVSSARGKKNAGIDEWFMEELETETMLLGSIGGDDEDGSTRIDDIGNDNSQPDVYYNLQGQRVDNPKNGLYIKNGKKIVIK